MGNERNSKARTGARARFRLGKHGLKCDELTSAMRYNAIQRSVPVYFIHFKAISWFDVLVVLFSNEN